LGAWALGNGVPELGRAACAARLSASEAFERAAVEMIQMHGGIGFTWESDCHLYYRRAKLLALQLGSARSWKHKLMNALAEPGPTSRATHAGSE